MAQKNTAVEALRFLFMVMICIHHSQYIDAMHHGYLAVEFYFILSGVFLYRTFIKDKRPGVLDYFMNRLVRFFPEYAIAFVAYAIIGYQSFLTAYSNHELTDTIMNTINSLFMLNGSGIFKGGFNTALWFVVVLIIGGSLLYSLLSYNKRLALTLVFPVMVISYYTYLFSVGDTLERWSIDGGIFYNPLWRGMSGLALGVMFWEIFRRKGLELSKGLVNLVSLTSLGLIGCMVFTVDFFDEYILLLVPCVLIGAFTDGSVLDRFFRQKVWVFLGGVSFEMYLLHYAAMTLTQFVAFHFGLSVPVKVILYLVLTVLAATLLKTFYLALLKWKTVRTLYLS